MTFEERAERLRKHPDTINVEIAGEELPWFIGKVTYDLARTQGVEFGDVIGAFGGMGEDSGLDKLEPMLKTFGQLLYFGMLPFDEQLKEADVTDFLSVRDMPRLLPRLMDRLSEEIEAEAGKAQAEAARKAQSAADPKEALTSAVFYRTCYGLLGYRPTDSDLDLLSLRQYLDALQGHLAAAHLHAALFGAAMAGEAKDAGPLFGFRSASRPEPAASMIDLKSRRPHWFGSETPAAQA